MASWIKMQTNLIDKPQVLGIGEHLDIPDSHVVGLLHSVWSMADSQADVEGRIKNCSLRLVNRKVSHEGFAEAMEKVGWLLVDGDDVVLPNYQEHNGSTAKSRAQAQRRMQKSRKSGKKETSVTDPLRTSATAAQPEESRGEEKRGEERVGSGEDHRCIEGGMGGGENEAYHGTDLNSADRPEYGPMPEAHRSVWSDEFTAETLATASRRFGKEAKANITQLPGFDWKEDRPTLLKIAACEACGNVSERWVSDACEGLRVRLSNSKKGALEKPVSYLCSILIDSAEAMNGGRTFQQILAPVKLPEALTKRFPKPQARD